jgi:hypothetical protein
MPIWLELMVLALLAYSVGLAIGWFLWGRREDLEKGNGNG